MSKAEKTAKKTELLNIMKPPKPLKEGLPDFVRDLLYMTAVLIIFFWCGASFHTLMHGYGTYKTSDFKGTNVNKPPYSCDTPATKGESMFSLNSTSSVYCAKGMETLWGVIPEFIEWYQNSLKDIFSSLRYILMRLTMQVRDNYPKAVPEEGASGFFGLMASSIIGGTAVFASPVIAVCLIVFYGIFMNLGKFFFVNNPDIVLKDSEGNDLRGEAEASWWIANMDDSYFSLGFGAKIGKWLFFNFVFFLIGLCVMFMSLPIYVLFSMLYWVTTFAAKGDKAFNKEGKFNDIWKILKKHSVGIASLWILLGGYIAWRNLGFGATIAAIAVLILHLGMNFFGYVNKENVDI
jgi:hypothetical protein